MNSAEKNRILFSMYTSLLAKFASHHIHIVVMLLVLQFFSLTLKFTYSNKHYHLYAHDALTKSLTKQHT